MGEKSELAEALEWKNLEEVGFYMSCNLEIDRSNRALKVDQHV